MINKMEVKGNIRVAGVYGIRVEDSQEYLYVGSSLEISDACSRHLYYLKRGLYANTNKAVLQEKYDVEVLVFEVIKESKYSGLIKDMSTKNKENLQEALSVLENFYIDMYKKTICNKQMSVTKSSSNHNNFTTIKRHNANAGTKNPNSQHDELIVANILWLKQNGYKNRDIAKLYESIGISSGYVAKIGIFRWINLQSIKPSFIA